MTFDVTEHRINMNYKIIGIDEIYQCEYLCFTIRKILMMASTILSFDDAHFESDINLMILRSISVATINGSVMH